MASKVVDVREAKAQLSRLLDEVARGEEVILVETGRPCAKLVPFIPTEDRRVSGLIPGRLDDAFFEPLPPEELDAWEGSNDLYRPFA
jgi:prevent-host-death family protein